MYFPVADIDVSPLIPVAAAFAISFVCVLAGISGAFLLLPFQMSVLGYTAPSVSATNHLFNIMATPLGVYKFIREKRMVWPLAGVIIMGSVPGTLVGSFIRVRLLPDPSMFKLFAAFVLTYIGANLLYNLLAPQKNPPLEPDLPDQPKNLPPLPATDIRPIEFSRKRIAYSFMGQTCQAPTKSLFALCFLVGIAGGTYGIGGGAIIAPFLISVFALPVHSIAAATLLGNFCSALSGLIFFLILSVLYPNESIRPDWLLGFLFGLGGLMGVYLGASVQKHVPAAYIKILLIVLMLATAAKYFLDAAIG